MKKKIFSAMAALALSGVMALGCFAADTTVVYDGTNITYNGGSSMSGFTNMLPGVTYTGSIQLENQGENPAYFYMDTSVVSTLISASQEKDTGYTVTLTCGDTTLYGYDPVTGQATGTLVGGDTTAGLEELNTQLEEYPLVATLDPGQTTTVTLSIQPDATATNSGYMGADGEIQFNFQAADVPEIRTVVHTETVEGKPSVITQVRTIVTSAQTGDFNTIAVCIGVVAAAAVLFVVLAKKKKKEE